MSTSENAFPMFSRLQNEGFEQIVYCSDHQTGLRALIAIHSTVLGPGTGGCRMYDYASDADALEDVLRLSKGMTYKASISGLELGGAKAVIIGSPEKIKTPELLKRFGQYVDRLSGNYITAKDVGINGKDLQIIHTQTKHVLGIEGDASSSGDPSPMTAWGVYNGMKACAQVAFGSPSLKGKKIAVQGLGYVSMSLVESLVKEGAEVVAADINAATVAKAKAKFGIEIVTPEEILYQNVDIVSPNAMGAILNSNSIPKLQCKVVAGAANNQLHTDKDGYELMKRGIVYAPDYAINAGGLINIYHERKGYRQDEARDHTSGIYRTIEEILVRSKKKSLPPHVIADRIAEERVQRAAQKK